MIEGFARTRGIDKWGVQIYTDAGVSGAVKLGMRKGGEKLLEDMKPGDIVIASKLDRMFRSASDAIDMFDLFKRRGVELVLFDISNEPVSSGVGKLIMTILAAVADMERIRIKERTAEGRKAKKARGGPVGQRAVRVSQGGRGAQSDVRSRSEGTGSSRQNAGNVLSKWSYSNISKNLAKDGILSRSGQPFTPMCIRRVLLQEPAQ